MSEVAAIPGEDPFSHPHERLSLDGPITVQEEGFIYIFVSNDDGQDMDVYFDDFRVAHEYGDIVAGGDHYPFGLAMDGRQVTREPYRYGYQGQFSEKDGETGWNSFEARQWDARVGRWLIMDPMRQHWSPYLGMGNNPVSRVDPDGRCDLCPGDGKMGDVYDPGTGAMYEYTSGGWTRIGGDLAEITISPAGYSVLAGAFNSSVGFLRYLDSFVPGGGYGFYNSERIARSILKGRNPDRNFTENIVDPLEMIRVFEKFNTSFLPGNKLNYSLKPTPMLTVFVSNLGDGNNVVKNMNNVHNAFIRVLEIAPGNYINDTVDISTDQARDKNYKDTISYDALKSPAWDGIR